MKYKILITGSKGFIGSEVMKKLSIRGDLQLTECDVIPADKDGYFNLNDPDTNLRTLFSQHHFDLCINCAGASSVPDSMQNPMNDFERNVALVNKLLSSIKEFQPSCRFLQLSSAAVYGNPTSLPVNEMESLDPVSPYGCHKLMAEELCAMYHRIFGIQSAILRIFSAYGPGLKKQLFWDIYQKSQNGNIELFGTGKESRDFIFVEDIVNAIECIIRHSDFKADVINVANGEEITIHEAASTFLDLLGYKGNLNFTQHDRKGDPVNWKADITKLKTYGYTPKISFKEGLKRYATWVNESR